MSVSACTCSMPGLFVDWCSYIIGVDLKCFCFSLSCVNSTLDILVHAGVKLSQILSGVKPVNCMAGICHLSSGIWHLITNICGSFIIDPIIFCHQRHFCGVKYTKIDFGRGFASDQLSGPGRTIVLTVCLFMCLYVQNKMF